MAVRKGTGKKTTAKKSGTRTTGTKPSSKGKERSHSWAVIFWLGFIILLIGLFLFNREAIIQSINSIKNEISGKGQTSSQDEIPELNGTEYTEPLSSSPVTVTVNSAPKAGQEPQTAAPPANTPNVSLPATGQTPQEQPTSQTQTTQTLPQTTQQAAPQSATSPAQSQTEVIDRVLYFILVDRGGAIVREKVSRKIPVSNSPMTDALQALIGGPNNEEKGKNLISLIPPGTRILSATVRGDTAYISFSEDFQYNTYGVEGYAGQVRQIIYTATEFSNVKNVQILIEGRRVDYLGEGIWIGSPLNRDML